MGKLDLAKTDRAYYTSPTKPNAIKLTAMPYFTITDKGDPSSSVFMQATEALFTLAYTVKFLYKKQKKDFTVAKLEGKWWVEGGGSALEKPRDEWHWQLRIRMPDFVTAEMVELARPSALAKKKELSQIQKVTFEKDSGGLYVQMMYIGPYSTELKTMNQMQEFMKTEGLTKSEIYHIEVYLSDPRKSDPSKMKTILRFPAKKV